MKNGLLVVALCAFMPACSGPRQGDDPVPAVARLVCDDGGARALTTRVRAVSDGIHLRFENRSGARQFYIRTVSSADHNHGGRLERTGATETRTTMPPGEIFIGCFEGPNDLDYYAVAPEYARLTIVDPEGLWIEPELGCDEQEARRYRGGRADDVIPDDVAEIVRSLVPDVLPTDQIVRPGYPETQWHGEFRHVVRNGTAIAGVSVYAQHGRWEVNLRACPGAVIG